MRNLGAVVGFGNYDEMYGVIYKTERDVYALVEENGRITYSWQIVGMTSGLSFFDKENIDSELMRVTSEHLKNAKLEDSDEAAKDVEYLKKEKPEMYKWYHDKEKELWG